RRAPLGQVLAIEQNEGVRRRFAERLRRGKSSGRDDSRLGPVRVVHVPFSAGQHRRVRISNRRVLRGGQQGGNAAHSGDGQKNRDRGVRFHFVALRACC